MSSELKQKGPNLYMRAGRDVIYHSKSFTHEEHRAFTLDVIMYLYHLIQTNKHTLFSDLEAFIPADINGFIKFSKRTKQSVFSNKTDWKKMVAVNYPDGTVQRIELSSVFDEVMLFLSKNEIPASIYKHQNEFIVPIVGNTFVQKINISIPNTRTGKRIYYIRVNRLAFDMLLKEYMGFNYTNLINIRGSKKAEDLLMFIVNIHNTTLNNKQTIYKAHYDVVRRSAGVNIRAYDNSTNIYRTHLKIKDKIDFILKHTDLEFTYRIDENNYYHFNFEKTKKISAPVEFAYQTLNNLMVLTATDYLRDLGKSNLDELSIEDRETVLKLIVEHFDKKMNKIDYHEAFVCLAAQNLRIDKATVIQAIKKL